MMVKIMDNIRVMIADDMKEIRDYFSVIVNNENGMEVVATASNGKEAIELVGEASPDVILMDIQMDTDDDGITATKIIKERYPEIKVIIVSIHDYDDNIMNAFVAGASDFILKTSSIVDIIMSIREAMEASGGRNAVNRKVINEMVRLKNERDSFMYVFNLVTKLTKSEFEVLNLVYEGKNYKDIANLRCVEEVTIRSLVNKILKKMQVKTMKNLIETLKKMQVFELLKKDFRSE